MKIIEKINFFILKLSKIDYIINNKTKEIHKISSLNKFYHTTSIENKTYAEYDHYYLMSEYKKCKLCYDDDDEDD